MWAGALCISISMAYIARLLTNYEDFSTDLENKRKRDIKTENDAVKRWGNTVVVPKSEHSDLEFVEP